MIPALALLTVFELGAGAGPGLVQDAPVVTVNPWAGARYGELALAIQGPLRIDLDQGGLRERDWDEPADIGRVLRFVRYGEHLRVGRLTDVTLGNGTLVRRYHNGVDDDHHRLGALGAYAGDVLSLQAFADQVVGLPVFAARLGWSLHPALALGATFAADPVAPMTLDGTVDDAANLGGDTGFIPAYGVDVTWSLRDDLALYADLNGIDGSHPGVHLGLRGTLRTGKWRIGLLGEGMFLGEGYDWALFDTGYLIDRQVLKAPAVAAFDQAWGGRGQLTVGYADALVVGAEYADANAPGRADLSLWLQIPARELSVTAFWRQRYGAARTDVFDPAESLAAIAATVPVHDNIWLSLTTAHVWRVDERQARLEAFTEAGLTCEVAFGL